MSKYISKTLTKQDVFDAIKIIFSSEEEENKHKKTLSETLTNFGIELKKTIKDIITLKFLVDMFKETKDECCECCVFLKKLLTFQFISDFLKDLETEPLDKAKLIKYGKKIKFATIETVETIVFVIIMVVFIRFFICELRWIPSSSMRPTLIEGDRIVVERYSRFKTVPQRGDIMVFYPPFEKLENTPTKVATRLLGLFCKDTAFIKRVIGVPGDKLEIKQDDTGKFTVYINDKPQNEPYVLSPYDYPSCNQAEVNCGPMTIPQGKYFMMGDNRGNSWDSRYWGYVPQERFIGRATFRFWPADRIQSLK